MGTSVVLRGEQGTGKGIFATNFGKVLGSHFIHVSNQAHITGRFNSHLIGAVLAYADEAFWAGDKRDVGVLKYVITEDRIIIEPKFQNPFFVKNYSNWIFASNSDWVVPVGLKERRFAVFDVSNSHRKDYPYFKQIIDEMSNGGRQAQLYDLLNMDISHINLREAPDTTGLQEQKRQSLGSVEAFWLDCLVSGCLGEDESWPENITIAALHKVYIGYAKDLGFRMRDKKQQFGSRIRELCPSIKKYRPWKNDGDRPFHYQFPPLEQARKEFTAATGIRFEKEDSHNSHDQSYPIGTDVSAIGS
jgi:hypothetical protein